MNTLGTLAINASDQTSLNCAKCGKANVCALLRAVAPLIETWGENAPIDVANLAVICVEYVPAALLDVLKGDAGGTQL